MNISKLKLEIEDCKTKLLKDIESTGLRLNGAIDGGLNAIHKKFDNEIISAKNLISDCDSKYKKDQENQINFIKEEILKLNQNIDKQVYTLKSQSDNTKNELDIFKVNIQKTVS